MWETKTFKTREAMVAWLKKREGRIQYEEIAVNNGYGKPTYAITKARGRKIVVVHYVASVDLWIGRKGEDQNWIETL